MTDTIIHARSKVAGRLLFAFLPLLLAFGFAGCERQAGDDTAGQPADAARGSHGDSAPTPGKQLAEPLPGGFELPFAYHLREDRVADLGDGRSERRVLVDVLKGNVASARKQINAAFKEKGFAAGRAVENRGGMRVSYRHKDGRWVNVTYWSQAERKPQARGAKAVVYFGFPTTD